MKYKFRICSKEIIQRFDPRTISEICSHCCNQIFRHYASRLSDLSKERMMIERNLFTIQSRLGVLNRIASDRASPAPIVEVISISMFNIPALSSSDPHAVIFNLDKDRLSGINPKLVVSFLSKLLANSIDSLLGSYYVAPRIARWAESNKLLFQQLINEVSPFFSASAFSLGKFATDFGVVTMHVNIIRIRFVKVADECQVIIPNHLRKG